MSLTQCKDCQFKKDTAIFELCTEEHSAYRIGEKDDFHTRTHMMLVQGNDCKFHKSTVQAKQL